MKTKETYNEWIEYCALAADDITLIDQAHEQAAGSAWLNFSAKWDLVIAVREWEPDLYDDATGEARGDTLEDLIRNVAFVMTRTKIEQKLADKQARYDWDVNRYGDVTLYKYTGYCNYVDAMEDIGCPNIKTFDEWLNS